MRWTVDRIAEDFIATAGFWAAEYLGEEGRRPMPVEEPFTIGREDFNRLVRFVRERLG